MDLMVPRTARRCMSMDLMVSRSRASVCKRGALSPDEDFMMMLAFPFSSKKTAILRELFCT